MHSLNALPNRVPGSVPNAHTAYCVLRTTYAPPPSCPNLHPAVQQIGQRATHVLLDLADGVSRAEVTACAAGANSIGSAFREIKHGYADAIIAGGAEAAICELGIAGFANLTALTKEADPSIACRRS